MFDTQKTDKKGKAKMGGQRDMNNEGIEIHEHTKEFISSIFL